MRINRFWNWGPEITRLYEACRDSMTEEELASFLWSLAVHELPCPTAEDLAKAILHPTLAAPAPGMESEP